jgi:hypothetical protein
VVTKVAKPITPTSTKNYNTKVVLAAALECNKAKFIENLTIYTLDGIKAILGNTFLNAYH